MTTLDIESILEQVELPETSVTLCLKGSLVARYESLDEQLQAAGAPVSLAGDDSAAAIKAQMDELRAQMLAHEATFTFRAKPPREFSDLRAKAPEKVDGQTADEYVDAHHLWVCEVVAACCVEPAMNAEQADRLSQRLSNAQWTRLTNAAWSVNTEQQKIPFSAAAYAQTLISGGKSRRQEPAESPEVGSLAGNPEPSPSTSTETTGA